MKFNNSVFKFRQRLHGTGFLWNWYEIGTDKPCVYTGPGRSSMDRICYLVPNGSTYEGNPMWNRAIPVSNRSRVNRVDPISNGSECKHSLRLRRDEKLCRQTGQCKDRK